jgi:uncharacterized membrane protein YkoI
MDSLTGMDEQTKAQYLTPQRREEILKKKYEQYEEQIISFELSNMMLEHALDIDARQTDKKKKLDKTRKDSINKKIEENTATIISSYEALRMIADMLLGDIAKEAK